MGKLSADTLFGIGPLDFDTQLTTRQSSTAEGGEPEQRESSEVEISSLVDTQRGGTRELSNAELAPNLGNTQPGLGIAIKTAATERRRSATQVKINTQSGFPVRPSAGDAGAGQKRPVSHPDFDEPLTQDTLRGVGTKPGVDFSKTLPMVPVPVPVPVPVRTNAASRENEIFTSAPNVTSSIEISVPRRHRTEDAQGPWFRGYATQPPATPKVHDLPLPVRDPRPPMLPEPINVSDDADQRDTPVDRIQTKPVPLLRSSEETFRPSAHTTPPAISEPRHTGRNWALYGAAALALVVLGASVVRLDHPVSARGVVIVEGGVVPAINQVDGPLVKLLVRPGDLVRAGQPIAEIDSASLERRRSELQERLSGLRAEQEHTASVGAKLNKAATDALQRKRSVLWERLKLRKGSSSAALNEASLPKDPLATDALLLIRQELADVEFELNRRQTDSEVRELSLEHRIQDVQLELAKTDAQSASIVAPVSGRIDALLASAGQVLTSGSVVAQLVPEGTEPRLVLAAPARTAPQLTIGGALQVHFASVPPEVNNTFGARITSIGAANLSREEAATLLKAPLSEPMVRVEVELVDAQVAATLTSALRPGEVVTADLPGEKRSLWQSLVNRD